MAEQCLLVGPEYWRADKAEKLPWTWGCRASGPSWRAEVEGSAKPAHESWPGGKASTWRSLRGTRLIWRQPPANWATRTTSAASRPV